MTDDLKEWFSTWGPTLMITVGVIAGYAMLVYGVVAG